MVVNMKHIFIVYCPLFNINSKKSDSSFLALLMGINIHAFRTDGLQSTSEIVAKIMTSK